MPGVIEVMTRSAVYTLAVLVVLVLDRAFEARTEHGGLLPAVSGVLGHPEMPSLWATAIAVGLSFVAYKTFGRMARAIGTRRLVDLFLSKHATDYEPQGER